MELICKLCGSPWNGHIVLDPDDKIGLKLYCEVCDLFIPFESKLFISDGFTGRIIDLYNDKVLKVLKENLIRLNDLPKTHPASIGHEKVLAYKFNEHKKNINQRQKV